jgi:hypothetical protein
VSIIVTADSSLLECDAMLLGVPEYLNIWQNCYEDLKSRITLFLYIRNHDVSEIVLFSFFKWRGYEEIPDLFDL